MNEAYITEIPNFHLIQICMDLVSAIWDKKREEFLFRFNVLTDIGKFAHFLQSLRRDKNHQIKLELLRELAIAHRITQYELYTLLKTDNEPLVGTFSDDMFSINISSFDDVILFCSNMWKKLFLDRIVKEDEYCLLELLTRSLTPLLCSILRKLMETYENLEEIIGIATELGLLVQRDNYYFSPCFLKESDEKTLDLITEHDIGTEEVIQAIEKVASYPGIPINSLSSSIQEIIREGGFTGLLLPSTVHLGSGIKEFVFVNPQNFKDGDLGYQVAAFIRYNEHFAAERKGVIKMPIVFLNRLIENGIAGNASNIGWNYGPLELKGVIKVVPGQTSGRFAMMLLKEQPVKLARKLLDEQVKPLSFWDKVTEPPEWLSDPATFRATHATHSERRQKLRLFKLLRDRG